jgi:CheY-like chemotaxis protein
MNKIGPILIIEDDADDQEVLAEIFKSLEYKNEVIYFTDGDKALDYLNITHNKPFLILSDINMPKLSGFELRDKIQNNEALRAKCIPYLFLTTTASHKSVVDAYSKSIQGFFVKPSSYGSLEQMVKSIIEYWQKCEAPNYQA